MENSKSKEANQNLTLLLIWNSALVISFFIGVFLKGNFFSLAKAALEGCKRCIYGSKGTSAKNSKKIEPRILYARMDLLTSNDGKKLMISEAGSLFSQRI